MSYIDKDGIRQLTSSDKELLLWWDYLRWKDEMAGKGKKFDFHGAFLSKAEAMAKEKEVGGFIRERHIDGKTRYFVLTEKK